MSKINSLLVVSQREKLMVKNFYNKTDEEIVEDLKIIKDWIKKQPHLPQEPKEEILERIFLRNKFRIERTKEKLDKYYSLRGLYPDFFYTSNLKDLISFMKYQYYIPLPKLTDKQERVLIWKVNGDDPDDYSFHQSSILMLTIALLLMTYDYSIGEIMVIDYSGFSFGHFTKMYPHIVSKLMKLYMEAFSARLISIQYINCPSFVDTVLTLLKPILKEKLYNKIVVNKDMESFYKIVPKKYLPSDYGGEQKSLEELQNDWMEEIKLQENYIVGQLKIVSNESNRIGKLYDKEMFGIEGTFKKINLD